jgi:hypothetical protein
MQLFTIHSRTNATKQETVPCAAWHVQFWLLMDCECPLPLMEDVIPTEQLHCLATHNMDFIATKRLYKDAFIVVLTNHAEIRLH